MSIVESKYATISCDGPDCGNTVTFLATADGHAEAKQNNPWMHSYRGIATPDNRSLGYCSDECEAKGIATGAHNVLQKKIIPGNSQTVDLAARAAQHAAQATAAMKLGSGVTLG